MNRITTSGRIRDPAALTKRNERPLNSLRTSSGSSMIRSSIAGTTLSPVARYRSTSSIVAAASNIRRTTSVQANIEPMISWPNPHA